MASSGRRRPSAWKHGLTSRAAQEALLPEVEELAGALLGSSPREPALLDAARAAAEAILFVDAVQRLRRATLSAGMLARLVLKGRAEERLIELTRSVAEDDVAAWRQLRETIAATIGGTRDGKLERAAQGTLRHELEGNAPTLRRLEDYERRGLSRRRKALRRLDYERIEAERRRAPVKSDVCS